MKLAGVGMMLAIMAGYSHAERSAESVLKGLEKAAAGQSGTPRAETRVFSCNMGTLRRQIVIEYPDTSYACRVIYDSENGTETLWRARSQKAYCESHAVDLVKKLQGHGWECMEK